MVLWAGRYIFRCENGTSVRLVHEKSNMDQYGGYVVCRVIFFVAVIFRVVLNKVPAAY